MIEICAIASGSNGNCYYIGNNTDAILVDAGISKKLFLERMEEKGLNPSKIRAIFISHEHGDHIRGVKPISKCTNAPVYITKSTFHKMWNPHKPVQYKLFSPGETLQIESLKVHSFAKMHDAADPASFTVEANGFKCGVMTDIGNKDEELEQQVASCDALILEANYDEKMLWEGPYPYKLKHRVSSDVGHLSNDQAYLLVRDFAQKHLQLLILGHISKENNTFEHIKTLFKPLEDKMRVVLATRFAASPKFTLGEIAVQQQLF